MSQAGTNGSSGGGGGTITSVQTANATPQFTLSGSTETVDFGITNLFLGDNGSNITSATFSTAYGQLSGTALTSGIANTFCGYKSGNSVSTGGACTAIGFAAQYLGVSGNYNTSVGYESLYAVVSGTNNIALGYLAGSIYAGASSSNIAIGNNGVNVTESNTIRIGTPGSGAGQQNRNFQAGITGVTTVGSPVLISSTGQLSDGGFGTATQVWTSNGAGVSPSWQAAGGISEYFSVNLTSPQNNVTGDGTQYQIAFDTQLTSTPNSNYNTSTGVYTAPATGIYSFSKTLSVIPNASGATQIISYWNGSAFNIRSAQEEFAANIGGFILSDTITIPMTAGDTMSCAVLASGGSKTATVYGAATTGGDVTSLFSGFRVA